MKSTHRRSKRSVAPLRRTRTAKQRRRLTKARAPLGKPVRRCYPWKQNGGGHLPDVPPMVLTLPPYVSCVGKFSTHKQLGGNNNNFVVSNFAISTSNLTHFKRLFAEYSPMDCVISALQIIGILDCFTANLLRITQIGRVGVSLDEIEKIFALRYNKLFNFKRTPDVNEFASFIRNHVIHGSVAFCGYEKPDGTRHVFLIGKSNDGQLVLMDPQHPTQQNTWCIIDDTNVCFAPYMEDISTYYLLFNYMDDLTEAQQVQLGFIDYSSELDHAKPELPDDAISVTSI